MDNNFYYLPEDEWNKAKWQYTSNVRKLLKDVFDIYGLGVFIDGTVEEIWQLTEDWSMRIRGVDKPISLDYIRQRRYKK